MRLRLQHPVPAHVRHLQALAGGLVTDVGRKAPHATCEKAEPAGRLMLLARVHERLQTDADAEEGFRAERLAKRRPQPQPIDLHHAVANRALPREDDAIGGGDHARIVADHDLAIVARNVLERLGDRAQVAHAVIDDGDALHGRGAPAYKRPLVEGITSAARVSSATAMRAARPKALKMVSAM